MPNALLLLALLAMVFLISHLLGWMPAWPSIFCLALERILALAPSRLWALLMMVLLWPSVSQAQDRSSLLDRAVEIANGAALVAHSADLATTVHCLAAKTCTEANPIVAPHVSSPKKFFAMKMGVALGSYVVKTKTKRSAPRLTLAVAIAENVAFFWIGHHNNQVHERARQ